MVVSLAAFGPEVVDGFVDLAAAALIMASSEGGAVPFWVGFEVDGMSVVGGLFRSIRSGKSSGSSSIREDVMMEIRCDL